MACAPANDVAMADAGAPVVAQPPGAEGHARGDVGAAAPPQSPIKRALDALLHLPGADEAAKYMNRVWRGAFMRLRVVACCGCPRRARLSAETSHVLHPHQRAGVRWMHAALAGSRDYPPFFSVPACCSSESTFSAGPPAKPSLGQPSRRVLTRPCVPARRRWLHGAHAGGAAARPRARFGASWPRSRRASSRVGQTARAHLQVVAVSLPLRAAEARAEAGGRRARAAGGRAGAAAAAPRAVWVARAAAHALEADAVLCFVCVHPSSVLTLGLLHAWEG
jgi:hypothetical protein